MRIGLLQYEWAHGPVQLVVDPLGWRAATRKQMLPMSFTDTHPQTIKPFSTDLAVDKVNLYDISTLGDAPHVGIISPEHYMSKIMWF